MAPPVKNTPDSLQTRLATGPQWLLLAVSGLALVLLSARLWLPSLGSWLVLDAAPVAADAIVPLAGGGSRVRYAAALFAQGYAGTVVATNAPLDLPAVDLPYIDLAQRELLRRGVPEGQIARVETLSRTTKEEAQAVRDLAEARGWRKLLVVTSPYHTRRSRAIFDQVLRHSPVQAVVVPVRPDPYDGRRWWQDVQSTRLTAMEYLKFVAHWTGYH